jgi:hypothetical protein
MDTEAGFVFGASAGLLAGAFCWLSTLDEEKKLQVKVNQRRCASNPHTGSSIVSGAIPDLHISLI